MEVISSITWHSKAWTSSPVQAVWLVWRDLKCTKNITYNSRKQQITDNWLLLETFFLSAHEQQIGSSMIPRHGLHLTNPAIVESTIYLLHFHEANKAQINLEQEWGSNGTKYCKQFCAAGLFSDCFGHKGCPGAHHLEAGRSLRAPSMWNTEFLPHWYSWNLLLPHILIPFGYNWIFCDSEVILNSTGKLKKTTI